MAGWYRHRGGLAARSLLERREPLPPLYQQGERTRGRPTALLATTAYSITSPRVHHRCPQPPLKQCTLSGRTAAQVAFLAGTRTLYCLGGHAVFAAPEKTAPSGIVFQNPPWLTYAQVANADYQAMRRDLTPQRTIAVLYAEY